VIVMLGAVQACGGEEAPAAAPPQPAESGAAPSQPSRTGETAAAPAEAAAKPRKKKQEPPQRTYDGPHARHVVIISIDTLRADRLGCYGADNVETPGIDGFAEEGILFENNFSTASTTLISHTSMMTGTYPRTHGVVRNGFRVPDENLMLAEVFQEAGFRTAAFVSSAVLEEVVNFNQGFSLYKAEFWIKHVGADTGEKGARTAEITKRAKTTTQDVINWLKALRGEGKRGVPRGDRLFLFIHYFDPHDPYWPEPEYVGKYREEKSSLHATKTYIKKVRDALLPEGAPFPIVDVDIEDGFHERVLAGPEDTIAIANDLEAEYRAEVDNVDFEIDRLLTAFKFHNMLDESIVIITSDHGETMLEHSNLFSHGESVYDTELHTPLIVRLPKGVYGGARRKQLVSGVDIAPTVLEAAGFDVPPEVEGSTLPLAPNSKWTRRHVFGEATKPLDERFDDPEGWANNNRFICVRSGRYKLMERRPDGMKRLYDLRADPFEQRNLIGTDEVDPKILAELEQALEEWRGQGGELQTEEVDSVEMAEHLAALKDLGYLGDSPVEEEEEEDPGGDGEEAPVEDPSDG
jgi:arylsulfatase